MIGKNVVLKFEARKKQWADVFYAAASVGMLILIIWGLFATIPLK